MKHFVIIGSGIIGLSIAKEIVARESNYKITIIEKENSIDIREKCGIINKSWNPITDIVDAYYICKYGFTQLTEKKNDSNI